MMGETTLFQVKDYVKADTPELLVEAQLENNFKWGYKHKYEIVYDGKEWFAWFETNREPKEFLNESQPKK